MRKSIVLIILLLFPLFLFAKESKTPEQKVVQAIHSDELIKIDGLLNEKVWQGEGYTDFVQSDPIDGAQPSEKTRVWVAYNEDSLYVAALLEDSEPELVKGRLGRRDDFLDSDWFFFAVDPYYDRRSGFQFAVNPSGSIVDQALYNDDWNDNTWDGVWEWKALCNDKGWAVEIRIPYNQLRFPKKKEYVWGVNFRRTIQRKNERITFVWVPKEDSGYVSRFARLVGIRDIRPGRHIELLPYTVGQAQFRPREAGNPFETGKNFLGNAGLDIKVGLRSNLTLDATVNPDFGQVEVDPAVINLTAFETYYSERRPFFIEGSSIFGNFGKGGAASQSSLNWSSPYFFYSRRIGRSPQGQVSGSGYVKAPDRSTILAAFKITGKVGNNWNIGFINALTAREYSEIDFEGQRFQEEVEPSSYFGVLRSQKEFNQGAQSVGFIATSVLRDFRNDDLENILSRRAFSLAIDGWTFFDKNRVWVLTGWLGGTLVEGSKTAISKLQKSSIHYFQRPDAFHLDFKEEATSLKGWGGRLYLNKQKGNLLFNAALGVLSPGFDTNDMGYLSRGVDLINAHLLFGYTWPHPGKIFRNWEIIAGPYASYDFGGNRNTQGYLVDAVCQFLNYWSFNPMISYYPEAMSKTLTRGGPLALIPDGYQISFSLESDSRKLIVFYVSISYNASPGDGYQRSADFSLTLKPRTNISLSISPGYSVRTSEIQWIKKVDDPLMIETFGARYVFGRINQKMLSSEIRLNWTFTPKLSLQLFLQPLFGVSKYSKIKELARPRSFDYNVYGQGQSTIKYEAGAYTVDPDGPGPAQAFSFSNPDFNMKSLRGTVVLRWEYMPGSLVYLVWTQNRADYANPGDFNLKRDLGDLLQAPGDNIFLIKISFRWNL